MEYFGVNLINNGKSFKLIRDEFALISTKRSLPYFPSLAGKNAYIDEQGSAYTVEWCTGYRELCLKNYDLNMEYFSKLNREHFDKALKTFLSRHKQFVEVYDLNDYDGTEGYYIMILEEYKQVYIGKTKNLKTRIMNHWAKTKPFDRTLCPMYAWETSCFSIDFFRAFDTTQIFIWEKKTTDGIEAKLISSFPSQFCTNRIGGDITTAFEAIGTLNKRKLI